MEPQVRFCTSADGTRIAYATHGEDLGNPSVHMLGFMESIEWYWQLPAWRFLFDTLAEQRCVVSFDRRGVGASQRDVSDLSLEAQLADLSAVVEALGLERFHLSAPHDLSAAAVMYAAQSPDRIRRLLLWDPYPCGAEVFINAAEIGGLIELIRKNWHLARRTLADINFPSGPLEAERWFARKLREILSPDVAAGYIKFQASVDIRALLPQVKAPTMVVHRPRNPGVPVSATREVADLIANARFVILRVDSAMAFSEADSEKYARLIHEFLDEGQPVPPSPAAGGLVTILFTDLASSTALTQRLGDAKAQELVRAHNAIVREALAAHGGSEIKHTGDGIMASFPTASGALECAVAIQRGVEAHNLTSDQRPATSYLAVHIGLNAGEPVAEESDLFGTSVQLARRICDHAQAGQILASNVVRELAAGKGFLFADIGEVVPKGFEEPVRMYEVRWRD